jgi:hypothetical protein
VPPVSRVQSVDVSLNLLGRSFIDNFPAHCGSCIRHSVRRRHQRAFDAMDAFAEHNLDAVDAFAVDRDGQRVTAIGCDDFYVFRMHGMIKPKVDAPVERCGPSSETTGTDEMGLVIRIVERLD